MKTFAGPITSCLIVSAESYIQGPTALGLSSNQSSSGPGVLTLASRVKNMKPIVWVGILLIVLGGLALAYQGFGYTRQEKVLDLGPIHATREDREWVSIPPVLGGLALIGGIVLLVTGSKKGS